MLPRREPDFSQMLRVLAKGKPDRPVLFEFLVDAIHLRAVLGDEWDASEGSEAILHNWVTGFAACGYDFSTIPIWELDMLEFPGKGREKIQSVGMAHGGLIKDRETLESYPWPNPDDFDYSSLEKAVRFLVPGQKIIIHGPGGVLENATELMGYEDLCLFIEDEPETARLLFDRIGERLLRHYDLMVDHPAVGGAFVNDDWGFKTQPFLSPAQMREFVFPWQKKLVDRIHLAGKPAILHSCGNLWPLWEDIIVDLAFDGKHSYEDEIMTVEDSYDRYGGRIAIMGGIDLSFLCRSTPSQVAERCRGMLERTKTKGAYALGSGNSIPSYIPLESYIAMQEVGLGAG